MAKKYWTVGSLVGLLLVAGFGCITGNESQPASKTDKKESSAEQNGSKLINPKGDLSVALSASDKQDMIADAKKIATAVFGNNVKLQGLMSTDFVAKGSIGVEYSAPEPARASQYDALVAAFKRAGYSIIDSQTPVANNDDKTGGVVGKKFSQILFGSFEPGTTEVSFTAMTYDQYVYLINLDEEESQAEKTQN